VIAERINLADPYMQLLIRRGEEMAERDNNSCVIPGSTKREGEAWAKRRRYLEQQQAKVEVITHGG
jgi:hypothetical protein